MKNLYINIILMSFISVLFASNVNATSFNFIDAIDSSYPGVIKIDSVTMPNPTGERGGSELVWENNGLTLTATASPGDFIYLDRGNAGIGICDQLTGSAQCSDPSDDNITVGEWITFDFGTNVSIDLSQSQFKAETHALYDPVPSGIFMEVDGTSQFDLGLNNNYLGTYVGSSFRFWTSTDSTQFYLGALDVNAVPEPGSLLLFVLGLAGFAGIRSKKKV